MSTIDFASLLLRFALGGNDRSAWFEQNEVKSEP